MISQKTGLTALMEATKAGAIGLVRSILKKGGNVNALDKKRFHSAHFAAEKGFFEVSVTSVVVFFYYIESDKMDISLCISPSDYDHCF